MLVKTDEDIWSVCTNGAYPDGTRFLQEDDRFWLSKDSSGARILFIQEQVRVDLREVRSIFSGLTLYQDHSIKGSRFVIKLEEGRLADKFGLVCSQIVKSVQGVNGEKLFVSVFNCLMEWSSFLRPTREGLEESAFRGLWGELVVFKDFYCDVFSPQDAVMQWSGPENLPQDFSIGDSTLEVKTTFQVTPKSISISSLEQLDSFVNRQAVAHVRGSKSLEGRCLDELVSGITGYLQSSEEALVMFHRLTARLLGDATEVQKKQKIMLLGVDCYLVEPDFPRLRRTLIDPGVLAASYEIGLSAIARFKLDSGLRGYIEGE